MIAQPVIDGLSAQVGILLVCCLGSSVASKSKLILISIGVTCHIKYKNRHSVVRLEHRVRSHS